MTNSHVTFILVSLYMYLHIDCTVFLVQGEYVDLRDKYKKVRSKYEDIEGKYRNLQAACKLVG